MIKSFTDLTAWKEAHKLTLIIYKETQLFPEIETYGLTSQMRRAAVSVTSNIAEGFGRNSSKDRLHFWVIADGSLYELKSQIILAKDLGYITHIQYQEITTQADIAHKLLHGLLRSHKI